jgi:dihydropteroate synthase
LDGKMVRETIGLVCLVDHESGVPHAMACMSMKEGEGDRCELKTAQKLVQALPDLNHQLVTADALHCQAATAQAIVAKGGDFLLQVKDNRKTVRALAEAGLAGLPPLLPFSRKNMVAKPTGGLS